MHYTQFDKERMRVSSIFPHSGSPPSRLPANYKSGDG
jgi:hypothetical protein